MNENTFRQFLQTAFVNGLWATEDVVAFILPLFENVQKVHEAGQVVAFDAPEILVIADGFLDMQDGFTHLPVYNREAIHQFWAKEQNSGFTIAERWQLLEKKEQINLEVQKDADAPVKQAVYIPGYAGYEMKIGHHDAQTDILSLGLVLGSLVMGLDLYDTEQLEQFVHLRRQPQALNNRIHPAIAALITEMTALDRSKRCQDLAGAILQLKYFRDYDPERQEDLAEMASWQVVKPAGRNAFVLEKLRDRLFDKSRRNRLLYYKPNSRFVNLTVGSVPMVRNYQNIQPETLFIWNDTIATLVTAMKDISLNRYLRFEDHPYLDGQLNTVRLSADNDEKEYGFSQLRLVIAFLHWHNLKEQPEERIQSPLLLLPVKLKRNKGLKEEKYVLEIADNTAMVNPVLSNLLEELYGIELPESIDLDETSPEQFFKVLQSKIARAGQGVVLHYVSKPRIRIIHSTARQTIAGYNSRLKQQGATVPDKSMTVSDELPEPPVKEIPEADDGGYAKAEDAAVLLQSHTRFELTDDGNNPYSWDFDICNLVLGNFHYKKMSLVSDYNKVLADGMEHAVFNDLFNSLPRTPHQEAVKPQPEEWYHVITADPTQASAIQYSRTGKSYVIQGPPGTGKSQTITNLVADFLARGKTVLFICEKRAALDVVYHRLQQNGLAELCCYIHDSQGDKKEFIRDLKTVYENFLQQPMDQETIAAQRRQLLLQLQQQLQVLQDYHNQQRKTEAEAGVETRQLIDTLVGLQAQLPDLEKLKEHQLPGYQAWMQFGTILGQLSRALENSGAAPEMAYHPFHNLGSPVMQSESPFNLLEHLSANAMSVSAQAAAMVKLHNISPRFSDTLDQLLQLAANALEMKTLAQQQQLQLVPEGNKEAREFDKIYQEYRHLQQQLQQRQEVNANWQQRFSRQEVEQALDIAARHETSFFRFLYGSWRRLSRQLKKAYAFNAHQLPPSFSTVLGQLQEEYRIHDLVQRQQQQIQQTWQTTDIEEMRAGILQLRKRMGDAAVDYLLAHPKANELVMQLSRLNNVLEQLKEQLQQCLYRFHTLSLHEIGDELATINANAGVLKELLPALRQFAALPEYLQTLIRQVPLTPQQAEAAMAHKTWDELLESNPQFAQTRYSSLHRAVKELEQTYHRLLQLNSDYIRAARRRVFLDKYEMSNSQADNLLPEQKETKKEYTEGRRILEHEMGKTMRYKSIRTLAGDQSGKVLRDIKPVWLMSPLSVSDSLPLDTGFFDVVIFDEASQIALEEGIPAVYRAPQVIIVGDEKQMPPSSFFNTRKEDPNDLDSFEGEAEEEILSTDVDSLLTQGARKLHNTMLSWHYRSRHETLISYSNHAFYRGDLLTVPDKIVLQQRPPLEILHPEQGIETAQQLLTSSVSFHYLPQSVYKERTNLQEAKYIAYMLKQLLVNNVSESIGIVAFSQEQQKAIEAAIEELAATDKQLEDLLEKAVNRRDNGQIAGLFIKNLESVQGDERDIIIISVCYGFDSRRKMRMNFGPVNRKGGEKRLNVIFSRARKHMAVVSSIKHQHITNDYNAGADYLKKFLHYAEMVSVGNVAQARNILNGLMPEEKWQRHRQFTRSSATAVQIKKALEELGYIVDERIGQSSFTCTLGVKLTLSDTDYSLGILLDDDKYYHNNDVMEQYYQRPALLQAFGWKVICLYAKDWLEDKEGVMQQLLRMLQGGEQLLTTTLAATPSKQSINGTLLYSPDRERFREIEVVGIRVQVRFGKTGTRGQVQVKTYASEAEAVAAMQQWIKEQVQEGWMADV